jgi:RHS repeat-associated protein
MRVVGDPVPANNGLFYLLGDHLGGTNIVANPSGIMLHELRYRAWGEIRYPTTPTANTDYRYTSQRQEATLGLYYYRARWYDPYLNRWTQPDSIVPDPYSPAEWDRYAYVRNNPVKYSDPSGHCAAFAGPGLFGIASFYYSCFVDLMDMQSAYEAGERRPAVLAMHGSGVTDRVVSTANSVDRLNADVRTVFSHAPIEERILPSVRVGTFAVSTAATLVGVGQLAKAALTAPRSIASNPLIEGQDLIDDIVGTELKNTRLTRYPQFDPTLPPDEFGRMRFGDFTRVGPSAIEAGRRETLVTIVHEEMHHRAFSRGWWYHTEEFVEKIALRFADMVMR